MSAEYLERYIHFMPNQTNQILALNSIKTLLKFQFLCLRMIASFSAGLIVRLLEILNKSWTNYYIVSGQLVNYQKSCIPFSNSISNADKKTLPYSSVLVTNKMDKYLDCRGIERHE